MSEERVVHRCPDFFAMASLSLAARFGEFPLRFAHRSHRSRRADFLSGIIQKTGPFAAVDVKAKGKH
ncbi:MULTISPECIES: hypothetical protein [unclassified Rhizobium]|uniref:hypothetical protein n=1 Tax=unclassified Rhizobium TaxID=2613769 RepID=UPI000FE3C676|nr:MULTISPECIES: hypothetical protein [unclassified Rhizobium]